MTLAQLLVPADAVAPPSETWGPVLVVALVVVAVLAMVFGFARIMRRRRTNADSTAPPPRGDTTSDDPMPTDPPDGRS